MTTAKSIIKKIRGQFDRPLVIDDPVDIRLAEAQHQIYMNDIYESQLKIKRMHNFALAVEARKQNLEAKQVEQERQDAIAQERLDNLKKARRKLERMRNEA